MFGLRLLGVIVFVIAFVVLLKDNAFAHPQPQEDYASYATLYPEIAKKIGEEPIEIIDVIKAVLVYDSDDTTPSSQTPESTEQDSEVIDPPSGQPETFQRMINKHN